METGICKGLTFNFIREEVMKRCEEFATLEEQVRYLRCVLKEKKNNPNDLDYNVNRKPSFEVFIQEEIDYREFFLKRTESKAAGLVKIKGKSGISDITRIFESMIHAGIISTKTETKQIGRIFFSEPQDIQSFADKYYARKNDIEQKNRSSNSPELEEFIKILINNSFSTKEKVLRNLRDHINKELQKVSSY